MVETAGPGRGNGETQSCQAEMIFGGLGRSVRGRKLTPLMESPWDFVMSPCYNSLVLIASRLLCPVPHGLPSWKGHHGK